MAISATIAATGSAANLLDKLGLLELAIDERDIAILVEFGAAELQLICGL